MKIDLTGHHVEVTDSMRNYVNEKFDRIARHFDTAMGAHVVLQVEKLVQKAEATVKVRGDMLFAEAREADMYVAIDHLVDKLDRIVRKHKEKQTDHHNREAAKNAVHAQALV